MNKIIRGQLVSFGKGSIEHIESAALAIDDKGRIAWSGQFTDLPKDYKGWQVDDYDRKLLLPGFIDAHIHFPQREV